MDSESYKILKRLNTDPEDTLLEYCNREMELVAKAVMGTFSAEYDIFRFGQGEYAALGRIKDAIKQIQKERKEGNDSSS